MTVYPLVFQLGPLEITGYGLMMMVAFDQNGAVRGCSVLAETGEARPDYGCDEVRAERFQASVGGAAQNSQLGVLTVLVYGHEEEVV